MGRDDDNPDSESEKGRCQFLNVEAAAEYLGLKRSTLDHYRWVGGGPRYRKHGGRVKYLQSDLEAWSESRQFEDTATRVR
ncbi:MAG TPA: helix-turn-helix domain-containing protein [Parvularculaceae bacterium]|nr:helix-turn-helix domain-containing protein [Amphiplicatus sp.]HPE30250.1 helix-turn-helix domain-containing protein [Parvularculaceae bacterium]HRX40596.1 helix-turn-helix domain-containing protein [Parvularculaceae bacterium]